jgi:hypothetical protein
VDEQQQQVQQCRVQQLHSHKHASEILPVEVPGVDTAGVYGGGNHSRINASISMEGLFVWWAGGPGIGHRQR